MGYRLGGGGDCGTSVRFPAPAIRSSVALAAPVSSAGPVMASVGVAMGRAKSGEPVRRYWGPAGKFVFWAKDNVMGERNSTADRKERRIEPPRQKARAGYYDAERGILATAFYELICGRAAIFHLG